ncbi:MAG: isoleucine--tRNA ligase, partial [Candidatus Levyibacteriota bacterium]
MKSMFKPVNPKVDFPTLEKELLDKWYKEGIVEKYLHKNDNSTKRFSFLDGPITANNPMGVHHAWGRTYKDLWQRFWNMRGYRERFQNGFDCQGLWVEVEVEKELGIHNKMDIESLVPNDKEASIAKFVQLCKDRVLKFSAIQTEQTKRLGNFMDWDNSYYTMSDENNYMIWYFLKVCDEKGWIYKGADSVPWCPRCQTAISQHEMLTEDYKEVVHESIFIAFPIIDHPHEYLLVWTTTPWTIPGNIAVAVDVDLEYCLVQGDSESKYWVVKDRVKEVFPTGKILKTMKGIELVGLKYEGPFDELENVKKVLEKHPDTFHTVIPTDPLIMPISTVEGTGLVHTAVSAGVEDFKLGKKLRLPMVSLIEDNADYLPGLGFLSGKNGKKHPELIFDFLKEKDEKWVFLIHRYKHRYPACWRCKTELVWKVTEEWYIAMDVSEKNGSQTLREQMVETAKKIDWHPTFGLDRELDWLTNMHDWLISKKNRYWGLALPIYECQKCGKFQVVGSKEELKEKAVSGWEKFDGHSPHKPFIDNVEIACSSCGAKIKRINDVGNVWLDAGIVPFSTMVDPKTKKLSYTTDKTYWKEWFPVRFITESFPGQFKNWFYSMIAMSTVLEKTNPFQTVLGYASVRDEKGEEMHKSKGNSIEFNEAADKIGVDVMRWMYVRQDPERNLNFGLHVADEVRRQFHLILWNVYNFFVSNANTNGWTPKKTWVKSSNVLDVWILSRLQNTVQTVTDSLSNFDPFPAATSISDFVSDLSLWYVRRSRDRVGPTAEDTQDRDMCYQTLHTILVTLSKLCMPMMPFLSDEIYTNLTGEISVHLADWPEFDKSFVQNTLEKEMMLVRKLVEFGHAQRKEKELKVRQPLAEIVYTTEKPLATELEKLLLDELNIKKATHKKGKEVLVTLDTKLTDSL